MSQARVRTLYTASKIILDLMLTAVAFSLAYELRITIPWPSEPVEVEGFLAYLPMMIVQVITIFMVFYANKLYHVTRAASRFDEAYQIFGAVSIGTIMAVAISAMTFKNSVFELDYPRAMIIYAWLLGVALIVMGREVHRRVWHRLRMRGIGRDRVLIVGSAEVARSVIQKIQWSPYLGYDLVGVVNGADDAPEVAGAPILGPIDELGEIVEKHDIQEVIIALPEGTPRRDITRIVSMCRRGSLSIKVYPDLFEFITTGVTIDDLGGIPLLNVRDIQLRGWKLSLKRALDVLGSAFGIVVLSPWFMFLSLLIKLESSGPVFYCQERMGLDGKPIQVIKFRSMRSDAEKDGPGWTVEDDPRVTRLGRWMRSRNVDELPQLINVFLGEMSLVGPRPERPIYVKKFRQSIPRYMERHQERAGMTGWAQVNGLRGNTSIAERTKYDLWYVENWSLWLDIRIIVRTIIQTVFGSPDRNAY